MKKTLLMIALALAAAFMYAQDDKTKEMVSTDDVYLQEVPTKGCNLKLSFFLPMVDETLEQFLGGEMFGIGATFDQALPIYYKKFKKVKKEELKNITVAAVAASECYRIVPSQVISVRYNSAGMKSPSDTSGDKYATYDFKNKKVVELADIVTAPVFQALKNKGLDVDGVTNIRIKNDSLFINIGEVNLNIDITKFGANMSDYAFELLANSRDSYSKAVEAKGNADAPTYPGGEDEMMKYLADNTHFPKGHQLPGMGGGRGMGMPPMGMGMPGGQPGHMPQMNNQVVFKYTVNADGSLYSTCIEKGIDPYFDAEALKVMLAMPKMETTSAASAKGRYQFNIPVTFRPNFGGFGGFRMF